MAFKKTDVTSGFIYNANVFKVTRGQDAQLLLHVFHNDCSPMSLVTLSSCETRLWKEDGSILVCDNVHHTVINTDPGIIRLSLSSVETAMLKPGTDQPIEVTLSSVSYSKTTKKLVQIENALTVVKSLSET
jgi:hypothetical protein